VKSQGCEDAWLSLALIGFSWLLRTSDLGFPWLFEPLTLAFVGFSGSRVSPLSFSGRKKIATASRATVARRVIELESTISKQRRPPRQLPQRQKGAVRRPIPDHRSLFGTFQEHCQTKNRF
jgi:hypothetical protein